MVKGGILYEAKQNRNDSAQTGAASTRQFGIQTDQREKAALSAMD